MTFRSIQTFITWSITLSLGLGVLIGCGGTDTVQAEKQPTESDTVFQEEPLPEEVQPEIEAVQEEVQMTDREAYVQRRYQEKHEKYAALYDQYKDQEDIESIQKARTYQILRDRYLEKIQGKGLVGPSTILENSDSVTQERYRRKHEKYSALYDQYRDQEDPESMQKAKTYKILRDRYLEKLSSTELTSN